MSSWLDPFVDSMASKLGLRHASPVMRHLEANDPYSPQVLQRMVKKGEMARQSTPELPAQAAAPRLRRAGLRIARGGRPPPPSLSLSRSPEWRAGGEGSGRAGETGAGRLRRGGRGRLRSTPRTPSALRLA
jgi:hypothetical protein